MKRSQFIKNVLGVAAVGTLAFDAVAEKKKFADVNPDDFGLSIDYEAIHGIGLTGSGGKKMTTKEILELFYSTGILLYRKTPEMGPNYHPIQVIPRRKKK